MKYQFVLRLLAPKPPNDRGFTIIESLVAVMVVTIMMVAFAPAIAFSVGSRVQAKRVERGVNAAKSYINYVRTTPPAVYVPPIGNTPIVDIPAPTAGALTCAANAECTAPTGGTAFDLFCIDGDGDNACTVDSNRDMIVQAMGFQDPPNLTTPLTDDVDQADLGYTLGLRVYRAASFAETGTLEKSVAATGTDATARTFGGAVDGDAPQFESTTEIVADSTNYQDLCNRLGGCN
ncbi:MAG: type II secretion system protein [Spirulinaceae cyanobacterium SM2_1_0]|nr:type II secretion system protein [Spirulinaceae cyanobacterium SM2_1_0]